MDTSPIADPSRLSYDGHVTSQPFSRRGFLGATAGAALLGAARLHLPSVARARLASDETTPKIAGPPPIKINTSEGDLAPGYILLTPTQSQTYEHGPLLIDSDGQVVWFHPVEESALNLQVQSYQGKQVLTWWQGEIVQPGYGLGRYFIYDTSYQHIATVRAADGLMGDLHEFVITPQGTALFTAFRVQPRDLTPVGGPSNGQILNALFQEVDIATGQLLFEWSAGEHVQLGESHLPYTPGRPYDFFHINSIDVDVDGNYLVSGRHTFCVYKVDSTTGKILWRLNGKKSDFTMLDGTRFAWQHHVRHHGDGSILTIFDDGSNGTINTQRQSKGLKLNLDFTNMTASQRWEYLHWPPLLASSQGSVQVLHDGHVMVGWGDLPNFTEFRADGKTIFDAQLPAGINSYRAFRSEFPAPPS